MNRVFGGLILAFSMFTTLAIAVILDLVRQTTFDNLIESATKVGIYDKVNPHLVTLELVFWLLFIIFFIALIIWYLVGSHEDEHETYEIHQGGGWNRY